jgi:hypothetical protein
MAEHTEHLKVLQEVRPGMARRLGKIFLSVLLMSKPPNQISSLLRSWLANSVSSTMNWWMR